MCSFLRDADWPGRLSDRLSSTGWEGQSLVVTLSKTRAPTHPIAGPTKGPACFFPSSSSSSASVSGPAMSGYSTPPGSQSQSQSQSQLGIPSPEYATPLASNQINYKRTNGRINESRPLISTTPEYTPIIGLPPPPAFIPVFPDTTIADPLYAFAYLPTYSFPEPAVPACHMNMNMNVSMNMNMNMNPPHMSGSSRAFNRPRRTVLVQNLRPTVTHRDLCAVFKDAGVIEKCQIASTDPTVSGSGPGSASAARITYTTPDDAKRAVSLFNNTGGACSLGLGVGSKRGRVRVRIDRSGSPGPGPGPGPGPSSPATVAPAPNTPVPGPATAALSPSLSPSSGYNSGSGYASGHSTNTSISTTISTSSGPGPGPGMKDQPLVVNGSGIGRSASTHAVVA